MKITKINHTRMAIGVPMVTSEPEKNGDEKSSVYITPSNKACSQISIYAHLYDRQKNAYNLYRVLTPLIPYVDRFTYYSKQEKDQLKRILPRIITNCNNAIDELVTKGFLYDSEKYIASNVKDTDQLEKYISMLVGRNVRSSLRKEYPGKAEGEDPCQLTSCIWNLMKAICTGDEGFFKSDESKFCIEEIRKDRDKYYMILTPAEAAIRKKLRDMRPFDIDERDWRKKIATLIDNCNKGLWELAATSTILNPSQYGVCITGTWDSQEERTLKEGIINITVNSLLRSSLRDDAMNRQEKDLLKKICFAISCGRTFEKNYESIIDKKITVLDKIRADFEENGAWSKNIIDSIQNQDVKVQIDPATGLLKPVNTEHPYKRYQFEFMKRFAETSPEQQKELQYHMQELILSFVYGTEYQEIYNIRNFKDGASADEKYPFQRYQFNMDEYFSPVLEELYNRYRNASKNSEKKQAKSDYGKMILKVCNDRANELLDVLRNDAGEHGITLLPHEDQYTGTDHTTLEYSYYEDMAWIRFISRTMIKYLEFDPRSWERKLTCKYLREQVWKSWISQIGTKFVDFGKAVYHFALPNLVNAASADSISFGLLDKDKTLTGFDYERIKAKESVERQISGAALFAVNNFAASLYTPEERSIRDPLLRKEPASIKGAELKRNILRYFGGQSQWPETIWNNYTDSQIFNVFKTSLNLIRNATFHYTASYNRKTETDPLLTDFFKQECSRIGAQFAKKFYSTNLWMFYSKKDILSIAKILYKNEHNRQAQIPSFGRIMSAGKKKSYPALTKVSLATLPEEKKEYFYDGYYFLLKQIYYYGFLNDEPARRFRKALESIKKESDSWKRENPRVKETPEGIHNPNAVSDFWRFIYEFSKNMDFGSICQSIMTEVMLQNTNDMLVHTDAEDKEKDEKTYKHFTILLEDCIRRAFIQYLKEDKWSILQAPAMQTEISSEEFCKGWTVGIYQSLEKKMGISSDSQKPEMPLLYAWYSLGHFLDPTTLNHLIGTLRKYIQFSEDIEIRAKLNGVWSRKDKSGIREYNQEMEHYTSVIRVLELVQNYVDVYSNQAADYFGTGTTDTYEDKQAALNAYADYMGTFVALDTREKSSIDALKSLCGGKYFDAENPILERNVLMSLLYGDAKVLRHSLEKVSAKEIRALESQAKELENVFTRGECRTQAEEIDKKKWQNLKNRVELYDVKNYADFLTELIGQLVSWCYTRERDRMYYQLGYWYTKLFYCNEAKDPVNPLHKARVTAMDGSRHTEINEGLLLYQIAASCTYDLPMIVNKQNVLCWEKAGNAKGPNTLKNYFGIPTGKNDPEVNDEGMYFFERDEEWREIKNTRNYIDHFMYYVKPEKSILDLYSEVYDRFFNYDLKLKKSVSFVLQNILTRQVVNPSIYMEALDKNAVTGPELPNRRQAAFRIGESKSGYKIHKYTDDEGKVQKAKVQFRSDLYVKQLKAIVEYKE